MDKSTVFGLLTILVYSLSMGYRFVSPLRILAILLHTVTLYYLVETPVGQNLSAVNMVCLITWMAMLFVSIAMMRLPLQNLLILIQPVALMSIVATVWFRETHIIQTRLFPLEMGHILLSILGEGLLFIAAIQAFLITIQEYFLRKTPNSTLVQMFPPIQVMEKLLFEFIWVGFIVLSLVVISGMMTWKTAVTVSIWYKLILSGIAWFVFAILLWGRKYFGWRGPKIARWTLLGVVLFVAAYFGRVL